MRKIFIALGLVAAFAIPVVAIAAPFDETKFDALIDFNVDKCKELGYHDGAFYYFVNPQTLLRENPDGGQAGGSLWADFGGAAQLPANPVPAIVVNRYNQHFQVWSAGELRDAYTNLSGPKVVLSHVTCKGEGGPSSEDFGL